MEFDSGEEQNLPNFFKERHQQDFNFDCNSLNMIDTSLFEPPQDYNLEKLFNRDYFSNFIQNKSHQLESVLNKQIKVLLQDKKIVINNTEQFFQEKYLDSFSRKSIKTIQNLFNKHYLRIFSPPKSFSDNFEEYIKQILSEFLDFNYHTISNVLRSYIKFLKNPYIEKKLSNLSESSKSIKRIPWTKVEENELFGLMEDKYPFKVSNIDLNSFADKYNRTKSAILNKMQKLKKKYNYRFSMKSEQIINDCVNGNMNRKPLTEKIMSILSETPKTFDEIISSLHITPSEVQTHESVNNTLYDLLNKFKVKCREIIYIEINSDKIDPNKKKSILIKHILDFFSKNKTKGLSFQKVKKMLIDQFSGLDFQRENFDSELINFLNESEFFVVINKRVFFM